jgi:deazaflavin-dependent oxidoreductase (nitroreductase family)
MAAWAAGLLRVRWLARAPIGLYRARLGFLLGSRLLMPEHLGRKSGTRRYVVLEVVAHPRPGAYVMASGFGARAQWFRNVRANPHVRIYAGETTLGARISDQETSLPMIAFELAGGSR